MSGTHKKAKRTATPILLVEDENDLRKGIVLNLKEEGYAPIDFASADQALANESQWSSVKLAIIDVMMPGRLDGFQFCRAIREKKYTFPIIFLTARSRLEDKLTGFELGGDDYLTKPFDLEELLARIAARLRHPESGQTTEAEVKIGEWIYHLNSSSATSNLTGEVVRFNDRESRILALLIQERGKPVSRDLILDRVWGEGEFPTNRTIDNFIVKFRKIFEVDPGAPKLFLTRHGMGYELVPLPSGEKNP